jgi:hypothetical protein
MLVNYEKMTGQELENIFISLKRTDKKITQVDFAKRLGIGRTKLLEQFKVARIDQDIEKMVLEDPELASKRTLINISEQTSEQLPDEMPKFHQGQDMLAKTLEMINETQILLKKSMDTITTNNNHIRGEATFLRKIVERGFDEGLLAWNPKALKKT